MNASLAVLLTSDDPGWLLVAEESVARAGHLVVATCPDAVSLLAHASLNVADVVLVDPTTLDIDRVVVARVRRSGLVVAEVGSPVPACAVAPSFDTVESALVWSTEERGRCGITPTAGPARMVAVFGCKGAPGATRLAIDLARRIAQTAAVSLVDLDNRGGDIGTYLSLPRSPNVVSAAQAIAHGEPWRFTSARGRRSVLVAPSRPGWHRDVVSSDIGRLLDDLGPCVVDGGSVGAEVDDVMRQIVARAACVVLVGGRSVTHRAHLTPARAVLESLGRPIRVVTKRHAEFTVQLARACASDAEQQRQSR